jgi:hypothetical protein
MVCLFGLAQLWWCMVPWTLKTRNLHLNPNPNPNPCLVGLFQWWALLRRQGWRLHLRGLCAPTTQRSRGGRHGGLVSQWQASSLANRPMARLVSSAHHQHLAILTNHRGCLKSPASDHVGIVHQGGQSDAGHDSLSILSSTQFSRSVSAWLPGNCEAGWSYDVTIWLFLELTKSCRSVSKWGILLQRLRDKHSEQVAFSVDVFVSVYKRSSGCGLIVDVLRVRILHIILLFYFFVSVCYQYYRCVVHIVAVVLSPTCIDWSVLTETTKKLKENSLTSVSY